MVRVKQWEKVISFKRNLTGNEMVDFALHYRENENCYLSARDDANDPGERHDIIYSEPRSGDKPANVGMETQVAKTLKCMFTAEAYGSIFLRNDIGYLTVYPAQIKIGAKRVGKYEDDRNEPPAELIQAALKLLPEDIIETITDYKNY